MAEIVITGGCGFLGRNLVSQLIAEGREVCATYNYTLPPKPEAHPRLSFFRCDVRNFDECGKLIMQENPVVVYHLVAQPIVTAAKINPRLTMELTTAGTWNILEACRLYGRRIRAIVFVSSDKVYGDNSLAVETDPLEGSNHPYNGAKIAADIVAQSYAKSYEMPIVISRSANLYGPWDFHWDRLIPGACKHIIKGEKVIIRSDGNQARDYVWVGDGVRGLMQMERAMTEGTVEVGEVFNFGSEKSYTALDVMHELFKYGRAIDTELTILNQAKDEIPAQHIVYEKAARLLNWKPLTGLEAGLDMTFGWYKEWLKE